MPWNISTMSVLMPLVLLLIGLTFIVLTDPYVSRRHRAVMLVIIALSATLIAQNLLENDLAAGPPRQMLRTAVAVYGYSARPVILVLFLYIVQPERKHGVAWSLAAVNCAIHMTAFFSHICFWINAENHYSPGPLCDIGLYISLALLGDLLYQSLRDTRSNEKRMLLIPCLVVLIIPLSVEMDYKVTLEEQPIAFLTFAIVICTIFYYIWLHMEFVREHEEDLKARQRIQIMLSQIQPHFLYNALGAIQYLCTHDPQAAAETTEKFARYLQGNISCLNDSGMVRFPLELEHTQIYLEIEQVRYGDALRVIYDITCTDFSLPSLTLQPIVENAVRHGARETEKAAGTVTVATREYPDRYEITVIDDGPGFDPDNISPPDDGRDHIGIPNVRSRLKSVCGGELLFSSEPGRGTTATLVIPKGTEGVSC